MMYCLLLDSSNKYLSVGLSKDGKAFDSIFYEAWQRQSEVMVSEIENILKRNNISKSEIEAIVVGIGPGSYTGVRIAITIAKTIAYALKIKVYKVSSLSLLRIDDAPTICVFNARSGRSYFGVYKGNEVIKEDSVEANEVLLKYISEHKDYKLSGDLANIGLTSEKFDIIKNLALGVNDKNLVSNIFMLNPTYLKDLTK
ncbi:MAG: tRNA (adenosine(37)-N6)-threonylcarbamoyltransferase complex dimerization subunit type 1 TsaB [Bacilli bacterium]|nr:tRNA (adenosine(37)-N6)-threonylcarbamoyltransferase complex dimerization subunit type 1 TsaB [Bacilli bacterium]